MTRQRNPYSDLPPTRFWRRSVASVERHLLDPVVSAKFTIGRADKVATAGSCFAQHIARKLQAAGFNYYVAETPPALPAEEARARGFGVFSARYGNLYTVRQLLQLFKRAHGRFAPREDHWLRPDGRFADPYRPNVEPGGYVDVAALREDRASHLQNVRAMFREADFFVFTLGLTEGWR
ncbi:MAG: GSCFA domain-containing protein, partial [Luteimonas sp.]